MSPIVFRLETINQGDLKRNLEIYLLQNNFTPCTVDKVQANPRE